MAGKKKVTLAALPPVVAPEVGQRMLIGDYEVTACTVMAVDCDAKTAFVKDDKGEFEAFKWEDLITATTAEELEIINAHLNDMEEIEKSLAKRLEQTQQRARRLRDRRMDVRQRLLQETAKEHGFDHIIVPASGGLTSIVADHFLFKVK